MKKLLFNIERIKPVLIGFGEMGHGIHTKCLKELLSYFDFIKGIFLEYPTNYQSSIDYYLRTEAVDEKLNNLLTAALDENKELKETLLVILNFAKQKNIPVICIDSSKEKTEIYTHKSEQGFYFLRSQSRDEDMFLNIRERLKKDSGSWLIFAHAAHLDTTFDFRPQNPSLGKRLNNEFGDKYFNICILQIEDTDEEICIFDNNKLDLKTKNLLESSGFSHLVHGSEIKGFKSTVIHK